MHWKSFQLLITSFSLFLISFPAAANECERPLQVDELLVPAKYSEREPFRRIFLDKKSIEEFRSRTASIRPEEIPDEALKFYLSKRLSGYSSSFQKRVLKVIDERVVTTTTMSILSGAVQVLRKSWWDKFFGPDLKMTINIWPRSPLYDAIKGSPAYYSAIIHEAVHVIQLNDVKTFGNLFESRQSHYESEFAAVLAEWEYWQLIPEQLIQKNIESFKSFERDRSGRVLDMRQDRYIALMSHARDTFESFHAASGYGSPDEVGDPNTTRFCSMF